MKPSFAASPTCATVVSGTVVVDATVDVTGSVAGVRLVMSTVDDGSPMDGAVSGGSVTFVVVLVVSSVGLVVACPVVRDRDRDPGQGRARATAPRRAETIGSTYLRVTWPNDRPGAGGRLKGPDDRHHDDGSALRRCRRIEIWMLVIEDRFFITGTPGPRCWLANVRNDPRVVVHVKNGMQADLVAWGTSRHRRADAARWCCRTKLLSWYRTQAPIER